MTCKTNLKEKKMSNNVCVVVIDHRFELMLLHHLERIG